MRSPLWNIRNRERGEFSFRLRERVWIVLLWGCLAVLPASAMMGARPDILFIAVDDLNDYVSPLANHPGIQTPNFDRLAARSVTFSNAHCAAPACHPSRVAVMTGVHPARSGIYRNLFRAHGPRWRHESPVLEDAVVLSQHFRNHGYRAVGGGKIFHTLQWTPGDSQNDPSAWDDYRGDPLDPISSDWPRPLFENDQNDGFKGKRPLSRFYFGAAPLAEPESSFGDHLVVDWAVDQLNRQSEEPLFLAVGLFRPHIPWEVPQRWFDQYPLEKIQLPLVKSNDLEDAHDHGRRHWHEWVTENDQWKEMMRGYLASISYVDHQLGRLLQALDRSGRSENTVVVLWSDHGFHIGEKENWEKFALWNQTTRVPLFIHAPGLSRDGEKTMNAVTLTDIYPTLCALAGLPTPAQCDGNSLVPSLRAPSEDQGQVALTSFQFGGEEKSSHAVADSRYRYIRYGNGFEELYDHRDDPHEFDNLAGNPDYRSVRARLKRWLPQNPAPNRGVPVDSPYHRPRKKTAQVLSWEKHVISESSTGINSALAHDLDKDGNMDVLSSFAGEVVLLSGPDWKSKSIYRFVDGIARNRPRTGCIHSCLMDVDADGDMDMIGSNNTLFWLECPEDPMSGESWTYHVVDDDLLGTHCLITGDVNGDGRLDLIANSGRTAEQTEFPNSLAWLEVPKDPRTASQWVRHVYGVEDAPGGSHYAGFGDLNGDGRPDIAYGAKGGVGFPGGEWFAWWEQPADPNAVWSKHVLSDREPGATNIMPADIDSDGIVDLVATRGHGRGVQWFRGPTFRSEEIDSEIIFPHSLDLADLDQDGDIDIVTCGKEADGVVAWYANDGQGKFSKQVIGRDQGSYDTRAIDMDFDGDLDLLIAGHASNNIVWFENSLR